MSATRISWGMSTVCHFDVRNEFYGRFNAIRDKRKANSFSFSKKIESENERWNVEIVKNILLGGDN